MSVSVFSVCVQRRIESSASAATGARISGNCVPPHMSSGVALLTAEIEPATRESLPAWCDRADIDAACAQ